MIEFGGNMNEKRKASTSPFEILKIEGNRQVDQPEKIVKAEAIEAENSDATEYSSSFDDSGSPDFHDDAESTLDSDGPAKVFNTRRRKLSSSWRSSIHSIMWRCKWIELQINKLEAQHKKYERKIEECNSRISTLEGDGTKLLTFPQHPEVRRKKRRRAEETKDIEAYMSNHNIFSYYDTILHPAKKKPACRHYVSKNPEFWGNDELMGSVDEKEDEVDGIWKKINGLHSRVVEMMSRLGKITGKENGKENNLGSRNYSSNTMDGMSMASYIASELLWGNAVATDHGEAVNFTCGYEDDVVLIDNHWVYDELCYLGLKEALMKKNHTIQMQTPLLLKPPPLRIATNDQTGRIDLDRAEPSIRSVSNHATTSTKTTTSNKSDLDRAEPSIRFVSNHATTSTKTTTSNKRPKREGPAQRDQRFLFF